MTSNAAIKKNYIEEVRDQYESYPYPPRNPAHEGYVFTYVLPSSRQAMNFYHYDGKRDFSKGFRALIAGGGTGDAVITMAEEARYDDPSKVEIVYLDISEASMKVSQERIKSRGIDIDRVKWVHGSLLDAPKILEGKFDHINCSGVLHHLESPEAGLAALKSVLKDDGVMAIMVYAKYGRNSVYQLQDVMRVLNRNEKNMQQKVENCKAVLSNIPLTNGFYKDHELFGDVQNFGDTGIYDLLLHSNDVAYTVPDLYKYIRSSDMEINHFFFSDRNVWGNNLYRLESYIKNPHLLETIKSYSLEEKQALAELLNGKIIKHSIFASTKNSVVASSSDHDNVPELSIMFDDGCMDGITKTVESNPIGNVIDCTAFDNKLCFINTKNAAAIIRNIDGKKTIGEIFEAVISAYPSNAQKLSKDELQSEFDVIYDAFRLRDWIFLRHKSVPASVNIQNIQKRMSK